MTAYYNEIDKKACAALRQLIAEGVIAPGFVDSRSIKEVNADDIRDFTQWHFFAGAGIWSVAARAAGWPDGRRILTASCPCQPFSGSGKGLGVDDPRHLWPDLFRIIRAARASGFLPPVLMGEQVSKAAGYGWFDGVRADLAAEGIASGTHDIPACAIDAPHERNRLYWIAVADTYIPLVQGQPQAGQLLIDEQDGGVGHGYADGSHGAMADAESERSRRDVAERGSIGRTVDGRLDAGSGLANAAGSGRDAGAHPGICGEAQSERPRDGELERLHGPHGCAMVDATSLRWREGRPEHGIRSGRDAATGADAQSGNLDHAERTRRQGHAGHGDDQAGRREPHRYAAASNDALANGSWYADAEWIACHDGKARRAKPGIPMLVNGMVGRSDLWSLAGNSISPLLAAEVIGAFLDAEREASAAAPVLAPPLPY